MRSKKKKDSMAPKGAIVIKKCYTCTLFKSTSEFYKDKSTKDRLAYECKLCKISRSNLWGRNNRNKTVRYGRKYRLKNLEKTRAGQRRYYRENKDSFTARDKSADPKKVKAKNTIKLLVRRKEIPSVKTLRCSMCSKSAQHYHHPNYSYPDKVIPLCRKCHGLVHRKYA